MNRFNISLVAERLTAYAIERRNGSERYQPPDAIPWQEQRRFWTDAILQGMARLDGRAPVPELMAWYGQRLEDARRCAAVEPLPPAEQAALIRDLGEYVSALEDADGDRREQITVVRDLLDDMATCQSWGSVGNGLSRAREQVESTLLSMTAQFNHMPHSEPITGFDLMAHCAGLYISEMADRYLDRRHGTMETGEKGIRVLKVEPGTAPEIVTMPNTLDAFQEAVGGCIETVGLDANTVLVCNEEGKLTGLPANRQAGGDIIAGTFLIVGAEDGEFCSLSDADAAHYAEQFAQPMPSCSEPEKPTRWEFYVL